MPEYDEDCLACDTDNHPGGVYYDDHVHKDDVYPVLTLDEAPALIDNLEDAMPIAGFTTKDSGERQQFDSGMQRDVTEGKIKWHLVASGPMLKRWAELMTRGAIKYDDDNWMRADSLEEYGRFRESAFRHFMAWYYGQTDEDHAAAVMFNINGTEYVNDVMMEKAAAMWNEDY